MSKPDSVEYVIRVLITPLSAFGGISALEFLQASKDSSIDYVRGTLMRMFSAADDELTAAKARIEKLEGALKLIVSQEKLQEGEYGYQFVILAREALKP